MFQDITRYIDFIVKHKLTQSQFLMLYLIRRKSFSVIEKYKKAFPTEDGTMIGLINIQDLIDRGFLEKVEDLNYIVTDKFNNIFLSNHFIAADEFWSLYPGFVNINGKNIPLTNMDKYAFSNIYGERIDYSVDEHNEVIKDIKFGRENNLITSNIENFVRSESWHKIREVRLGRQKVIKITRDLDF